MEPVIAVYVLWLVWFLSWLASAMLDGRARTLTVAQDVVYRLVTVVGAVTLLFGFLPDPGMDVRHKFWLPLSSTTGWILTAVLAVSLFFYWWARISAGFTLPGSSKPHAPYVEAGPYRLVRHPIYLSLTVAGIATALIFGRPSSLAGAVLLTAAFVVKILIEESVLRADAPGYDDYAERVPMLLPLPKRQGDAPAPRSRSVAARAPGFHSNFRKDEAPPLDERMGAVKARLESIAPETTAAGLPRLDRQLGSERDGLHTPRK